MCDALPPPPWVSILPPLENLAFQGLTWPFSRQNHTFRTALWKLEMSERDTSHYAHVLVHAYIAPKNSDTLLDT